MAANPIFGESAPSLPGPVLYGATGLLTLAVGVALWRANSRSERLIIFAAWFRYILSAFHAITFKTIAAGLTGQAIATLGIIAVGAVTIDLRHALQRFFIPCYAILGLIVLSGILNREYVGIVTAGTKYGYFLIVAISLFEALGKSSEQKVFPRLLWAFAPLLLFQLLSVALGVVKAGESDGSASYIGGYNHEAAFSIALATCLLTAFLASSLNGLVRNGVILACLVGILLANYRTTILAIGPIIFTYYALPELKRLHKEQRNLLRFTAILTAVLILVGGVWVLQTRLADLGAAFHDISHLIRPPETFGTEDQRLLSGRPFIWSVFLYAYADGTALQHVIGQGPESWVGRFPLYPHNTAIAYLFEFGWIGVGAIFWLWGSMMICAWQVKTEARARLLAGHFSFLLLNMATMPHWQIEGNIFYGILCGYTLYHKKLGEALAWRAEVRSAGYTAPSPAPAFGSSAARLDRS